MDEDFGLDVLMEDVLNDGYGYILDEMNGEWDNDPNPYEGSYSEE